jgi:arylsulfatase
MNNVLLFINKKMNIKNHKSNYHAGIFSTLITISVGSFTSCDYSNQKIVEETGDKPNILLILTDDQGHGDLSFHGNPYLRTPHMDTLAMQSTRFTRFYVSPVSAPTRASLMTGRYSLKTGVYDTYNGGSMMFGHEKTIAEYLKEAGYSTALFGKWHLGDNYPFRPQDQGFDEVLMHGAGGIGQPGDHPDNYKRWKDSSYFDPVLFHNGEASKMKGYCTDILTDAAIDFIEKNKSTPFFAYVSYNAPHEPHILPEEYHRMYKDLVFDTANYPQDKYPTKAMNEWHKTEARKLYGMVANIDDNIGRLLKKLDALNISDSTLVIFMTDNGPWLPRYNSGFRGLKGSVYEGGIRVPCFFKYPGKFPADKDISVPAAHLDLLPTLLDLCGLKYNSNIDGKSLLPIIIDQDSTLEERSIIFQQQRGFVSPYYNIAVQHGDYKLVGNCPYNADIQEFELYNIANDPYETTNISSQNTELVKKLKTDFDSWFNRVGDQLDLTLPRIILGSKHENPVILTRNDLRGIGGKKWTAEKTSGYWDIEIAKEGNYDMELIFKNNIHKKNVSVRIGTREYKLKATDHTTNKILFEDLSLKKGDFQLKCWYEYWGKNGPEVIWPFYVKILHKTN